MNQSGLINDRTKRTRGRSRWRDLLELSGIYALILIVIWTPRPWQFLLLAIAAIATFYIGYLSFEALRPMGLSTENLVRSLWAVGCAMVVTVAAIALADQLHTLHIPPTPGLFLRHYGIYAVWAGVQQIVLQWFFLSRSLRLLPDPTSAAAFTAGLFAVAHLSNPILAIITLVFGFASCYFFICYRNLVPLALTHAMLGICIGITIPASVDHNMRVGIEYLTYADKAALSNSILSSKPQRPD